MTIADLIRIVRPFLRCLRADDINGLQGFLHEDHGFLRFEQKAVAGFQHGSTRKRDRKFDARIRDATAVALPADLPRQRDRVTTKCAVSRVESRKGRSSFKNNHRLCVVLSYDRNPEIPEY